MGNDEYGPVRNLFGIYYIIGVDLDGWWITNHQGYKTMMKASINKVTAPDGGTAYQGVLGRWMLMLIPSKQKPNTPISKSNQIICG